MAQTDEILDKVLGQPDKQADEIGAYAIHSLETFKLVEASGAEIKKDGLEHRQLINAAKKVVGKLHSLALEKGIKPPEAAILELSEDAEDAALELLELSLELNGSTKRPMDAGMIKRIGQIMAYNPENGSTDLKQPGDEEGKVEAVALPPMTLTDVGKHLAFEDGMASSIAAIRSARAEIQ